MKVMISSLVLGRSEFRHTGDFLATPTMALPNAPIGIEVGILRGVEPQNVAIRLVVTLDDPESPYAFTVDYYVLMAFDLEGEEPPKDFDHRLMVTGATMAFPYAREMLSNLTARGRFGPVWLNPTDFNALLADKPIIKGPSPIARDKAKTEKKTRTK